MIRKPSFAEFDSAQVFDLCRQIQLISGAVSSVLEAPSSSIKQRILQALCDVFDNLSSIQFDTGFCGLRAANIEWG